LIKGSNDYPNKLYICLLNKTSAMITTKGQIIEINDKTEWLLFHRLTKKVNPVDFLTLTDSILQLPNFLFTVSFLILIFLNVDLQLKFVVPVSLYFCGQILINLHLGVFFIKLLNVPLLVFQKFSFIIMPLTIMVAFLFLSWWTLMVIPSYLLAAVLSILILTMNEKRYYRTHWNKTIGNYQIFKNNAFLLSYKYYATGYNLPVSTSPTEEEIKNEDWLKPYVFMRAHWNEIEEHFNKKAKLYWRLYLNLDK
jgi:hypothetical protein